MKPFCRITVLSAALTLIPAVAASATTFKANLMELNNSGVTGIALLKVLSDQITGVPASLQVTITATGLEPNQLHVQHIHGRFSGPGIGEGNPIDSQTPPASADTDGDGFIEVGEGVPFYGPIILPLSSPSDQSFPTAPNGTISFSETYDLSNNALFSDPTFTAEDLFPLVNREIVIHGRSVAGGIGAGTNGEVNGTGGYLVPLPVAAGEIQAVPEPQPLTLLGAGIALVFGAFFKRQVAKK